MSETPKEPSFQACSLQCPATLLISFPATRRTFFFSRDSFHPPTRHARPTPNVQPVVISQFKKGAGGPAASPR